MVRKFTRLSILLSVILLTFSAAAMAASDGDEDKTSFIMHHVKDSHEWHFATIGHTHVTLSLPVIIYSSDRGIEFYSSSSFVDPETHHFGVEHNGYYIDDHDKLKAVDESRFFIDLSITKNVAMLFLILAVTLFFTLSASGYYKKHPNKAPRGIASFIEPIVLFVRDEIAKPNIGPKYKKFTPYLLTLFFFIWVGNLLGLMPGAANLTGNIAVTFSLAIITFFITNFNGNKDYWKHVVATPGVPLPLLLVIVPVEIIGLFTKPFALTVRLFVAITAGHIVILSFIGLIFVFESYAVGVASTFMVVFINVIELLVATIQAYVFTLFSAMYIGSAVAEHGHEH
ncbi:F0F1 ATP synthase subunit A [Cyclobacterium marinum]|uniref:ATP synthase subunit a n=1 Tax=Cyclobacterium marinum (strain ATCC 25205 / DSM 745 / LMG 13164 / NCIMB 1802) TaxID=880070 RepID=G0IWZ2_CYCMS|nr:F0F1 ATP synthase subunit A [Cyclobacterium marinum]AEL24910.1 ATP synthase subunit a [Cyclobacterium marinum DSM 745]